MAGNLPQMGAIKLLINKEYLHFLGLTFMCQNKYLAAMQRNNYTVMLMH
jgi:hypothetical protein